MVVEQTPTEQRPLYRMQLNLDAWEVATTDLTDAEFRALFRVCGAAWRAVAKGWPNGCVPDDDDRLGRIIGGSKPRRTIPAVRGLFKASRRHSGYLEWPELSASLRAAEAAYGAAVRRADKMNAARRAKATLTAPTPKKPTAENLNAALNMTLNQTLSAATDATSDVTADALNENENGNPFGGFTRPLTGPRGKTPPKGSGDLLLADGERSTATPPEPRSPRPPILAPLACGTPRADAWPAERLAASPAPPRVPLDTDDQRLMARYEERKREVRLTT